MSEVTPRLTEARSLRHGGLDLLILSSSQVDPVRNRVMPDRNGGAMAGFASKRHSTADHLPPGLTDYERLHGSVKLSATIQFRNNLRDPSGARLGVLRCMEAIVD